MTPASSKLCVHKSDPELISRVQLVKRDGTHFHIVRPEHALRRLAENSTLIGWTLDFDCCLQEHLARTRSEPVSWRCAVGVGGRRTWDMLSRSSSAVTVPRTSSCGACRDMKTQKMEGTRRSEKRGADRHRESVEYGHHTPLRQLPCSRANDAHVAPRYWRAQKRRGSTRRTVDTTAHAILLAFRRRNQGSAPCKGSTLILKSSCAGEHHENAAMRTSWQSPGNTARRARSSHIPPQAVGPRAR